MADRFTNWRTALNDYVHAVMPKPFVWGQHDCATFAAGAVLAMTGVDPAEKYRGRYKTLIGGLRLLRKDGFDNHAELAASQFEEIHPSHAAVGDIAAVRIDDSALWALGVVNGPRIFVLRPDASGLGTVDLLTAERAFRI